MRISERRRGAAPPALIGAALVLVLGTVAGCGDSLVGPGDRSASARSDPVELEGITVPAPCRAGECDDGGTTDRPDSKKKPQKEGVEPSGGSGDGGSGPSQPAKPRDSKCVAAVIALATAMSFEKAANDVYKLERRESDAAASTYVKYQKAYAPAGLTAQEARHLAELKAAADRERREMERAEIDLRQKKRAVELAKFAVIAACSTGPE